MIEIRNNLFLPIFGGLGGDQTAGLQAALAAFATVDSPCGGNDWERAPDWVHLVAQIRALHPAVEVVPIGHSWGAEAAIELAGRIGAKRCVAIDPVKRSQWGNPFAYIDPPAGVHVLAIKRTVMPAIWPCTARVTGWPAIPVSGDHNSILHGDGLRMVLAHIKTFLGLVPDVPAAAHASTGAGTFNGGA